MTDTELDRRIELGVLKADLKIAEKRFVELRAAAEIASERANAAGQRFMELQCQIIDFEAKGVE